MMRPQHFCAAPGCNVLIDAGSRCARHMTEKRRWADAAKPAHSMLYKDARWRNASRLHRARQPLCVACGGLGVVTDHIVPHKGDIALFWQSDNWQTLCVTCHNRKSRTE